ncbi:cyclic lactone autoinducer peptide [uncultured Eubacterium sp.]|uniref:cyclic lactone autoinducer peptide n=1 Tax=uncultured Eubacterium sp. TaxID=165185 RepID=UPI0025E0DCB8|nr:cyclic lactone autoinducer peptide [uncultured Eubacterium sp.]
MHKTKHHVVNIIKKAVENSCKLDANSTTCWAVYQPKVPTALKKFSKVENDK